MKRKMAIVGACLAVIILAGCNADKIIESKPAVRIQEPQQSQPTKQQECAAYFQNLEYSRYKVYCQDINLCLEPCWPKERQMISDCLQAVGEQVTEEKIQKYLDILPSPEFFKKSRELCLTWGKTEKERQDCLSQFSQ